MRTYENKGFWFRQSIRISLDYNLDFLSKVVADTSKFKNPPSYHLSYRLKDENKAKEEVLALAFKDAEAQARAIATGAGKQLGECESVSFEPFSGEIMSHSNFGMACEMAKSKSVEDNIKASFVPTDVEVEKTVYCVFNTKENSKPKAKTKK